MKVLEEILKTAKQFALANVKDGANQNVEPHCIEVEPANLFRYYLG